MLYSKTHHIEECVSTQDLAHGLALANTTNNALLWVQAKKQSQGRGRQGHQWENTQNSLLCSLAFRWPKEISLYPWFSLLMGWSTYQTLIRIFPHIHPWKFFLKWPNDILLSKSLNENFKVGGILCEKKKQHMIVGWGINIDQGPKIEFTNGINKCLKTKLNVETLFLALQTQVATDLEEFFKSDANDFQQRLFKNLRMTAMKPLWQRQLLYLKNHLGQAHALHDDGSFSIIASDNKLLRLK